VVQTKLWVFDLLSGPSQSNELQTARVYIEGEATLVPNRRGDVTLGRAGVV